MVRHAIVVGAGRAFGAEIVRRLEDDGFAVIPAEVFPPEYCTPLDLLVVNRPVSTAQTRFRDLTDAQFEAALEDRLMGLVVAVQAAVPLMTSGGSIVIVGSRAHLGTWSGADQVAAGASMIGMMRSMALELADHGIRVNLLAPDFVEDEHDVAAAGSVVAGAIVYVAGPDGRLVSGETILLDGGRSLRMTEAARRV